jgi:hypothetical protein
MEIPNKPPPAYFQGALATYLTAFQHIFTMSATSETPNPRIPIGL